MSAASKENSHSANAAPVKSWRWGGSALIGLFVVFALAVLGITYSVREDTRKQLLAVDSHVLSLLVQNQLERAEQELGLAFSFETLGELEVWSALLETASLEGVFAVQLFGLDGNLKQSTSDEIIVSSLPAVIEEAVLNGKPVTDYRENAWLSHYIDVTFERDEIIAVSDIYIPLWNGDEEELIGLARYLMDGSVLSEEFKLLDERLTRQAGIAVGLGGLAISLLFWMAWKKLSAANRHVLRHAERLKKANAELAMLARTSAVGSVTAHLIHGLKNPLAGLREVVGTGKGAPHDLGDEEWEGARNAADRMQRMIEEVVGVLQDSRAGLSYELSIGEVLDELEKRYSKLAAMGGKTLRVMGDRSEALSSKEGNIVLLVASNLTENALEAVERGGDVEVNFERKGDAFVLRVSDDGKGIEKDQLDQLFTPTSSGKTGGAGIGLAISKQLAQYLGGSIRYLDTIGKGAVFELSFPVDGLDTEE